MFILYLLYKYSIILQNICGFQGMKNEESTSSFLLPRNEETNYFSEANLSLLPFER